MGIINKVIIIIIFSFSLIQADDAHARRGAQPKLKKRSRIPTVSPKGDEEQFQKDLDEFIKRVPEITDFRDRAINLYGEITESIQLNKLIKRSEAKKLYALSKERKEIRQFLWGIVTKYKYTLLRYSFRSYRKGAETWAIERATLAGAALFWLDDNYLTESVLYQNHSKLRRFINERNATYGLDKRDGLYKSAKLFYSFRAMWRKYKALKIIKISDKLYRKKFKRSKNQLMIDDLLKASYAFKKRRYMSYSQRLNSNLKKIFGKFFGGKKGLWDFVYTIKDKFIFGVAYAFGRSVAQIQWKKGKLYYDTNAHEDIAKTFIPGDVIWDKTRGKISGAIISLTGFWNHNAIYVGTEKELKDLGLWDHELVKPHQKLISNGKVIIEALGPGVVINTIHHFMNIDEISIASHKDLTEEMRKEVILRTFAQMGKKYDFNLNVESAETVICSELVYIVYEDVDFEKERLLGYWSITPDLTAKKTFEEDAPFTVKSMYYKGKKLKDKFIIHMKNLFDFKKTNPEQPELLQLAL